VSADPARAGSAIAEWASERRARIRGWRRTVLIGLPLIYVAYVIGAVAQYSHGAWALAGYAIVAAFCLCFVAFAVLESRGPLSAPRFWLLYGLLVALFAAEVPFARAPAFVLGLYVTMIGVARLGARAVPIVIALVAAAIFVPVAVPSWHQHLSSAIGNFTPIAIPVVALVTFVVVRSVRDAVALAEARAELARLAAENERSRIARDLHDLLGHSLTTITLKAGLARRLAEHDPERAAQEIAEVEGLSRQALTEVRAAVSNYRDVTLAGELAQGRELLRASGVTADLPTATDVVDPANQELFGWAVREGLTNVARHANATRCTVTVTASEVEIRDDGVGGPAGSGHGLAGLRERVAAAGGTVQAGPISPCGWRLRVAVNGATIPPA
jgi:two-component system, NarL family, sensor histidine kinase DesK